MASGATKGQEKLAPMATSFLTVSTAPAATLPMVVESWVLATTSLSSARSNFDGYTGCFCSIVNDRGGSRGLIRCRWRPDRLMAANGTLRCAYWTPNSAHSDSTTHQRSHSDFCFSIILSFRVISSLLDSFFSRGVWIALVPTEPFLPSFAIALVNFGGTGAT